MSWINLLYTNISSSIIVNGDIGFEFPVIMSVRRGCAIFFLSTEPLPIGLGDKPGMCGFKTPGTHEQVRVSHYAEDTTLLLSGAKLNKHKTCGIWLGRRKDMENSPRGSKRVESKKLQGVHFSYRKYFSDNWGAVMEKFVHTSGFVCAGSA